MSEQDVGGTSKDATDRLVGQILADRYEVTSVLAEGGMGRVYRGVQRTLNRKVAIKCIHPHLMADEHIVARFMDEALVASRLSHSNVVDIYDFGRAPPEQGGSPFIVMEFLEGVDLGTELERGPLALARVGRILSQVLSALAEAHAHGITHRDVKPGNVFLMQARGTERVKVIDFGIARAPGARRMTQVGTLVGSPNYMPPEQIRGEPAQASTDLYAVGAMLFEMLTGQRLFDDDSAMVILQRQLSAPRPDPRAVAPERNISERLAQVCLRAIDVDPAQRLATADELAQAIEEAIADASTLPKAGDGSRPARALSPNPGSAAPIIDAPESSPQSRYRVVSERTDLAALHRLEREAISALEQRDSARAEKLLERGLRAARDLVAGGDTDTGASAWGSFGRRLALLLHGARRFDEARGILQELLDLPELSDRARASSLELLALVHRDSGRLPLAEEARRAALALGHRIRDAAVIERLEQASASPAPPLSPPPPAGDGREPPKHSTWRSKYRVVPKSNKTG